MAKRGRVGRVIGRPSSYEQLLPIPPTPLPDRVAMVGVNLAGGEFGSGNVPGTIFFDYTYPSHAEIDYYARKRMKVLRVPFLIERLQVAMNGALRAQDLNIIDDLVSYAAGKGVTILLDPHNYGFIFNQLINTAPTYAAFAQFWSMLAAHYRSASNVWFGLMNEPNQQTAAEWRIANNQAIAAIRAAGATQLITVPGTAFTGAWTWIDSGNAAEIGLGTVDPLNNYVFEVHQYLDSDGSGSHDTVVSPTVGIERITAITQWAHAHRARLLLGECGVANNAPSFDALRNMLNYMQAHFDVWLSYTYWAGGPLWGEYMFTIEPTNNFTTDRPQMSLLEQYVNL